MKIKKKILSLFLAALMIALSIPYAFASTVASGTCGSNLTWTLDSNGKLTISGSGDMYNYEGKQDISVEPSWHSTAGWSGAYVSSIKEIYISSNVTSIGEHAFYNCINVTKVTIGSKVKSIGEWSFCGCESLPSITIPSGVESIGELAFDGCKSITQISIPSSVKSLGSQAFSDCEKLTSVSIGSGLQSIDTSSFVNCQSLLSFSVSSSNSYFSSDSYGCLYDKDKTILRVYPSGNTRSSFTIPNSVQRIGPFAFSGCQFLTSLSIPSSVTSIDSDAFESRVFNKVGIKSFSVNSNNSNYSSDSYGCLYDKNKTMFIQYPIGNTRTSFTVPSSVTSIKNEAFCGADKLVQLTISNSVKTIGSAAFEDCTSLKNVSLSNQLTTIESSLFWGCTSLESATIPNSVTTIKRNAFMDCKKMTSVVIPTSVKRVEDSVFTWNGYSIGGLEDVYYTGSSSQWNAITIDNMNGISQATIHYNYDPAKLHKVTYNYSYNGGSSATSNTKNYLQGESIDLTPTAKKSGWTFVGWTDTSSSSAKLNSKTMGTSDVTLYAIYKKTLTGTFIDYSGTTKKTTTKTVDIYNNASSGTLSAPAQNTYTGWTKRGWTTGTAADASTVSSYSINNNTTFYGVYQRTLTLSYDAQGGSPTPSNQTGTQYANSYSISNRKNPSIKLANAPSKTNNTFEGWAMGSASGTKYAAGTNVTISTDTKMYASWKPLGSEYALDLKEQFWFANGHYYLTGHDGIYNEDGNCTVSGCHYVISEDDYNKLEKYIDANYYQEDAETITNNVQDLMNDTWGGSCYGFAAATVLDKTGQIGFNENFYPKAKTLSEVDPPFNPDKPDEENLKVQSAINYYMISQKIPLTRGTAYDYGEPNWSAGLEEIVEAAKNGQLMMFGFGGFTFDGCEFGHEVVVKGYEKSNDKNGGHYLIAYDNNCPERDIKIWVTDNYDDCWVLHPDNSDYAIYGYIYWVEYLTDFSDFDLIDIDGPNNDMKLQMPTQKIKMGTEVEVSIEGTVTIKNAKGETLNVSAQGLTGNMQVLSKHLIVKSNPDGSPAPLTVSLQVKDSDTFTFSSTNSHMEASVRSSSIYAGVKSDNANKVVINEDKGVYMLGSNFDYSASISLNNDFCDMLQIGGKSKRDTNLLYKDGGVQVSGEQKEKNQLTIFEGSGKDKYSYQTSANDLLITNNKKGEVVVLAADKTTGKYTTAVLGEMDLNGSGTTSSDTDPSTQEQKSGSCKYCGGEHTGLFGWLTKIIHNILFAIFGAKK